MQLALHLFPVFLMYLLVVSCAQPGERSIPAYTKTYSSVAVTTPGFSPQASQTFAWHSAPVWTDSAVENHEISRQFVNAVNSEFLKRGYKVVSHHQSAEYLVGLVIITEGGDRNEAARQFFNLFPGLGKSAANMDKGMIAMGVIPHTSATGSEAETNPQDLLWRSALEAFILGDKINNAQREARINLLASNLMKSFPAPVQRPQR